MPRPRRLLYRELLDFSMSTARSEWLSGGGFVTVFRGSCEDKPAFAAANPLAFASGLRASVTVTTPDAGNGNLMCACVGHTEVSCSGTQKRQGGRVLSQFGWAPPA
jgi:hypothetical protein